MGGSCCKEDSGDAEHGATRLVEASNEPNSARINAQNTKTNIGDPNRPATQLKLNVRNQYNENTVSTIVPQQPYTEEREDSFLKRRFSRDENKKPTFSMADVVGMALRKAHQEQGLASPQMRLDKNLKDKLHLVSEEYHGNNEIEKISFETGSFDLVNAFQNIDRDRDGQITVFDMVRELKRSNPLASKEEITKYQKFLEAIMPEYSHTKDGFWNFHHFQKFMYDSEQMAKKKENSGKKRVHVA